MTLAGDISAARTITGDLRTVRTRGGGSQTRLRSKKQKESAEKSGWHVAKAVADARIKRWRLIKNNNPEITPQERDQLVAEFLAKKKNKVTVCPPGVAMGLREIDKALAAGDWPDKLTPMASLTVLSPQAAARMNEIVRRVKDGQKVRDIALAMEINPSTVVYWSNFARREGLLRAK
jgi:hypothetical protein